MRESGASCGRRVLATERSLGGAGYIDKTRVDYVNPSGLCPCR